MLEIIFHHWGVVSRFVGSFSLLGKCVSTDGVRFSTDKLTLSTCPFSISRHARFPSRGGVSPGPQAYPFLFEGIPLFEVNAEGSPYKKAAGTRSSGGFFYRA
ncbi:hypothetical protein ACE4RR_18160, partial [Alteribacillus sp. HJP-4]